MKIIKHSLYNLLGLGLPLLVAVFSIPVLIKELGEARFGLLTLIWAVVSYFGLFDLGLGRVLTQQLSVAIADNDNKRIGPLIATATALMASLGGAAGLIMALLAGWGVGLMQSVPDQQETIRAVMYMALAMPSIVLTSGFRGILEARHAFGIINAIRLPMGLFTFLGPVLVVLYGSSKLDDVTGVLCAGRIIACAVHAWFAWRILPTDHGKFSLDNVSLRPLCVSGGWLTLSNVISPFMGYVDRFIISGVVSAVAVAYYTTPQELILKLSIFPAAITAVLFPTFAMQSSDSESKSRTIFDFSVSALYLILLPVTLFFAIFSSEILFVWIGVKFANESALFMKIFSFGILLNSTAHVPYTLIQGRGAPKLTAMVHLVEFPFFLCLLWWLTDSFGLVGASISWFIRITIDTILMFTVCFNLMNWRASGKDLKILFFYLIFALISFSGVFIDSIYLRSVWLVVVLLICMVALMMLIRLNGNAKNQVSLIKFANRIKIK